MDVLKLDGTRLTSEAKFHASLREIMDLPDYYGENLDALWDCITGWIELPTQVVWMDYGASRRSMGDFADKARALFEEAEREVEGFSLLVVE